MRDLLPDAWKTGRSFHFETDRAARESWASPTPMSRRASWRNSRAASRPRFQSILRKHGVIATLRREKGHDIAAACGKLRLQT